eukprot:gene18696-biopygen17433
MSVVDPRCPQCGADDCLARGPHRSSRRPSTPFLPQWGKLLHQEHELARWGVQNSPPPPKEGDSADAQRQHVRLADRLSARIDIATVVAFRKCREIKKMELARSKKRRRWGGHHF